MTNGFRDRWLMWGYKMKVLVTGANGYIGHYVVKALLDKNIEVVAVDMNDNNIDVRARIIKVDIFSGERNLYEVFGCPDACLHLAWQDGFIHNSEKHIKMLYKHYEFLNNLMDCGLRNLNVMGTMHEIGYYEGEVNENTPCNPISLYGIAKNALRQMLMVVCEEKKVDFKWLRAFYICGDDEKNNSIFAKIITAEKEGKEFFPFTTGKNKYDFIDVRDLAVQIVATVMQKEVTGIINCCGGNPVALKDKVEEFIERNKFNIKLRYGVYPDRKYDSPAIWGSVDKISHLIDKDGM